LAVAPKPTKSTTLSTGFAPASAVVELTSAILPAVALIGMVPVASGVSASVPPLPAASCTR
jgi:hypothetical protein